MADWISVKDRLPDPETEVQGYAKGFGLEG